MSRSPIDARDYNKEVRRVPYPGEVPLMGESIVFQDQLLATKFFTPSSTPGLVSRPHLLALLARSLECALTLVSAPAGFGKTTLLSSWVQSLPTEHLRIAWVSLD